MLCCKLSFFCCHWEFVCCQLICSYSTITNSAVCEWTFYSFNQITMLFKHYPCYQILIIFFTFWVIFHCATNSHVEHIMAFVLIPCCQSKTCAEVGIFVLPSVEVVIWCCLEIKYWAVFFFLWHWYWGYPSKHIYPWCGLLNSFEILSNIFSPKQIHLGTLTGQ